MARVVFAAMERVACVSANPQCGVSCDHCCTSRIADRQRHWRAPDVNHESGLEDNMELDPGSDRHCAEIVQFLSNPENYPDAPADVRIIETHSALVFLAGDRVYKMKRPIRLDFLDCRSLDDAALCPRL